jgi:hypothetical protein
MAVWKREEEDKAIWREADERIEARGGWLEGWCVKRNKKGD